jgi:hypothetical protein
MRTTPRFVLAAVVAVALAVAACGGDDDDSADGAGDPTEQPSDDGTEPTEPGSGDGETAAIDACSLLSEEEAAEILGAAVAESGPAGGVGESICEWSSAEEYSVTVAVGSEGTAPGNTFEPDELLGTPEPVDGLQNGYFFGAGQVDFAADDRHNYVQVVTSVTDDSDRPKAEELAKTISARIEQG